MAIITTAIIGLTVVVVYVAILVGSVADSKRFERQLRVGRLAEEAIEFGGEFGEVRGGDVEDPACGLSRF
ncbi:hypothetical protein, partial [Microbacterium sp. K22]|uniref:hypothetical protein n=1 Tax=Microbacterium sp. K22 TaxID=2305447 RepID=UPI00109D1120